ncbi:Zinc finger CCHC-type superfamily [Arabidopsis thaliana x Arabidopsis arenosa]|uniref:Zinc finger CCHC-type superfamily n=1 Tax=Arabidopsis thaliana x Arabidopsis arenosa TaxID=1240361 RepID=A0A8T2C8K7_9BRAS|nr:Zinc finger CCHC-type superfamily [Arabidopsis thaliana x Arabidopsis arenosa]
MGKSSKSKKKKSSDSRPPSGSVSPASSSSKSSVFKQQSPSGSSAPPSVQQNASALAQVASSAIVDSKAQDAPDLGEASPLVQGVIDPSTINASAIVPTKSSAISDASISGSPDLGRPSADVTAQIVAVSDPQIASIIEKEIVDATSTKPSTVAANSQPVVHQASHVAGGDSWVDLFKGTAKSLSKKGEAFTLPSGESCVRIPNSIIEKNQKSWESFIIGQFYADPPPQALIHTIVNGIWSRHFKDISVSKLEGNAFLFRIPNSQTRRRVLNQRLWQVEGQTMFVANWEPGMVPVKPELSSAPIWLELRDVPLQFFHEDGLERIAGLVGEPKFLHPSTANRSNLEVAKVFTIIDPRKPLPEAVNVLFDSGDIARVRVSSPWMPPICSHCKEVGHSLKRCRTAPLTCKSCKSTSHNAETCPRVKGNGVRKPKSGKGKSITTEAPKDLAAEKQVPASKTIVTAQEKISVVKSNTKSVLRPTAPLSRDSLLLPDAAPDSSDTSSSEEGEIEEDYVSEEEHEYLEAKISKFVNAILPGWLFEENYAFSELGKIWILWHPSVKVVVLFKSLQMVTCEVQFPDNPTWFIVSFVYASNDEAARRSLWTEIVDTASNQAVLGKAWAVLGDFNQILSPSDHSTRTNLNMDIQMRAFSDALLDASLQDLTYRGCSYTWWNKRSASPVAKKLDRILTNDDWLALFPLSTGFFGAPAFSDHSPSTISLNPSQPRKKKPFKFFNYILKNPAFLSLVCNTWFSINVVGSDMFRVSFKLRHLKKVIRQFSKLNYSNIEKRVQEALAVLDDSQVRMLTDPSEANAALELDATKKIFSTRQSINHIHFLEDEAGNRVDSQQSIQDLCVNSFKEILGSDELQPLFAQEDISSLLNFECSLEQKAMLGAGFSEEDIKAAFFSLPRNKSSGPDGYSAEFFISCWSVLGAEVTADVAEFFSSGTLLKQWNATTLVLIPKTQNASRVADFRPISCLNTMYKVISKLLADRLKSILPSVISHSQSAFLPGRLLSENVLLASEIVQGYNRKNIAARAMLKVDLRKAFDTVRWDFILSTLKALGIPEIFTAWIKECICTPSFSISVNGMSDGFFRSSRGLRQGDPLSPYLFVLAMEVFSKLTTSRFDSGYINYHPNTTDLRISHLMFADDVMIFFDGSSSSLHGIYETLEDFAGWSGLNMNRDKTVLFHAGLSQGESSLLANYGFPSGSLPVRYLGLPLMSRKLKISEYSPLLVKLTSKFRTWAVKSLSFAGRSQLLSSVIYGIVNFWISTFKLPNGCIRKIESLCSRFLWSGNIDSHTNAKVSWASVCLPKSEGGLGLRRVSVWNTTLCLRLIWLLFSNSGSLWVAWQIHHHRLDVASFWNIQVKSNDSWLWKSLLKLRALAQPFIKCNIGAGSKVWFWHDSWTPLGPLINLLGEDGPRDTRIPLNARVSDACSSHGWRLASPRSDHALALHAYLTSIPLPSPSSGDDSFDWVIADKPYGSFSSSKTWEALRPREAEKDWSKLVWFKGSTPKHAFNMWIANLDRLPTMNRLASWGLQVSTTCCLCSSNAESRDHIFLHCPFSLAIWDCVMIRLRHPRVRFNDWSSLLGWVKARNRLSPSTLRLLLSQAIVYSVWRQRNNLIHNQVVVPPLTIFKEIDRQIINSITARRKMKKFRNLMALWLH